MKIVLEALESMLEFSNMIFYLTIVFSYFWYEYFVRMSVYHGHTQCPVKSEEGIGFPDTGVKKIFAAWWVKGMEPKYSERAVSVLNRWGTSPVSKIATHLHWV